MSLEEFGEEELAMSFKEVGQEELDALAQGESGDPFHKLLTGGGYLSYKRTILLQRKHFMFSALEDVDEEEMLRRAIAMSLEGHSDRIKENEESDV